MLPAGDDERGPLERCRDPSARGESREYGTQTRSGGQRDRGDDPVVRARYALCRVGGDELGVQPDGGEPGGRRVGQVRVHVQARHIPVPEPAGRVRGEPAGSGAQVQKRQPRPQSPVPKHPDDQARRRGGGGGHPFGPFAGHRVVGVQPTDPGDQRPVRVSDFAPYVQVVAALAEYPRTRVVDVPPTRDQLVPGYGRHDRAPPGIGVGHLVGEMVRPLLPVHDRSSWSATRCRARSTRQSVTLLASRSTLAAASARSSS